MAQEERIEAAPTEGLSAREFILWTSAFVLGVIVGGALGVLFTPRPGPELREQIARSVRERAAEVKERVQQAAQRVKEKYAEVKERLEKGEEAKEGES